MMRTKVQGSFSDWIKVLSGVPQCSVIAPLLFLLFVNDLPKWVVSSLKMFADDTKLWRSIKDHSDSATLQVDLNQLSEWSNRWQLKFNPSKCKLMHVGHRSQCDYYMDNDTDNRTKIEEVTEEKDLGVYMKSDLKLSLQCTKSANRARLVLGTVRCNLNVSTWTTFY